MDNGGPNMWCYTSLEGCSSQDYPGCEVVSAATMRMLWAIGTGSKARMTVPPLSDQR
jgi:hypothetical protein